MWIFWLLFLLPRLVFASSFQDLIKSGTSGYGQQQVPLPPAPPPPVLPKGNGMMGPPTEPPFRPPGIPEDIQKSAIDYPSMDSYFSFPNPTQMQMPPQPAGPMPAASYYNQQPQYYPQQANTNWNINSNNQQQQQLQQQFHQQGQLTHDDAYEYPQLNAGAGFVGAGYNPTFNAPSSQQSFPFPTQSQPASPMNTNLAFNRFFPMGIPPPVPEDTSLSLPKPDPNQKEYSYDWTLKSPRGSALPNIPLEVSSGKGELLSVRDLLATQPPKILPPMPVEKTNPRPARPTRTTTASPLRKCIPNDVPSSTGFCSARKSNRNPNCGSLPSSLSSDCDTGELCCFMFESPPQQIVEKSDVPGKGCRSSLDTSKSGFCSAKSQRRVNCAGLIATSSADCSEQELCCIQLGTQAPVVRTCRSAVDISKSGVCVQRSERRTNCAGLIATSSADCSPQELCCLQFGNKLAEAPTVQQCIPSIKAGQTGFCAKRSERSLRCSGLLAIASGNCAADELCCFSLEHSQNKAAIGASPLGAYTTLATTTTAPTYPPTMTYATRSCIPVTHPEITNGTCVSTANIATVCKGVQISTSLDCYALDLCCFQTNLLPITTVATYTTRTTTTTTPATSQTTTTYSTLSPPIHYCTPADEPNVFGFCVSGNMLQISCFGLQISTSLSCNIGQYCCFGAINTPPVVVTPPPYGQCSPKSDPMITNGTCVKIYDLAVRCQGIQAAVSADCAFGSGTQLCCFGGVVATVTTAVPTVATNTPTTMPATTNYSTLPSSLHQCTPIADPTISNGFCVASNMLQVSCIGLQISSSLSCGLYQYCCFTPSIPPQSLTPLPYSCVPDNNPTVIDGYCVGTNELETRCNGVQISMSRNCPISQFCCYNPTQIGRSCSPQSDPKVKDGKCVGTANIATSCQGILLTPSFDCLPDQYCCFNNSTQPVAVTQLPYGQCSPQSNPKVTNGTCVKISEIAVVCQGIQAAVSADCASGSGTQLCCYGGIVATTTTATTSITTLATTTAPTTARVTTTAPTTAGVTTIVVPFTTRTAGPSYYSPTTTAAYRSCTPSGNRNVKDGFCVANMNISNLCKGIQIAPSLNCMVDEYCCYQPSDVLDIRPGGACIPQSNPSILNGVCVDPDQLNVSCKGVQMSASRNCYIGQFCCFNTDESFGWGYGAVPAKALKVKRPTGSCKPNALSDADNVNGICVDTGDVMDACQKWEVARSDDCSTSQYCCYSTSSSDDQVQERRIELPTDFNRPTILLPNRDVLPLVVAAKNRLSSDSNYKSFQDTTVTSTPTSPPMETTVTTAYTMVAAYPQPSRGCRPMANQNINNGICVTHSMISSTCSALQVSPSLNCYANEFCCFLSPPSDTSSHVACRPDNRPDVEEGICYRSDVLTAQCSGRQLGYSSDCKNAGLEFCCFREVITTPSATLPSSSTTTEEASTITTTLYPWSVVTSYPQSCRPIASPTVTDGQCVEQSMIALACSSIQISPSQDCSSLQSCCFSSPEVIFATTTTYATTPTMTSTTISTTASTAATTTATTTPSTTTTITTPTITTTTTPTTTTTTESGFCIPVGYPTVANGFCVNTNALGSRCDGIEFSTSDQCRKDELCCYTRDYTTMAATSPTTTAVIEATIPTTAAHDYQETNSFPGSKDLSILNVTTNNCNPDIRPDITSGFCVDIIDLATKCVGIQASQSRMCLGGQFCCFDQRTMETTATKLVALTRTENNTGDTISLANLARTLNLPDAISTSTDSSSINVTIPETVLKFL